MIASLLGADLGAGAPRAAVIWSDRKARTDMTRREISIVAGLDVFRIHDLRRAGATGMAELGISPHTIWIILNHVRARQGTITQGLCFEQWYSARALKDKLRKKVRNQTFHIFPSTGAARMGECIGLCRRSK